MEAQLSTFFPLVHALSREVASALDSAADALNALGAGEHGGHTDMQKRVQKELEDVHKVLEATSTEVEVLRKLLDEERLVGSERVASALQALESVKIRWREEELTWRTETDELRVRVGELQLRIEVHV